MPGNGFAPHELWVLHELLAPEVIGAQKLQTSLTIVQGQPQMDQMYFRAKHDRFPSLACGILPFSDYLQKELCAVQSSFRNSKCLMNPMDNCKWQKDIYSKKSSHCLHFKAAAVSDALSE